MANESQQSKADETTPLIGAAGKDDLDSPMNVGRSISAPALDLTEGVSKQYDVNKVASWRVFTMWNGTIFEEKSLWVETLCLASVYCSIFLTVHFIKWEGFKDFVGKEENIHALMGVFCTLIG